MSRKIVITSGKGGVGKTTITAELGLALARTGESVVLVDFDTDLCNLDVVLGIENNVIFDINDVFVGRCRIKQALITHPKNENLYILPSGTTVEKSQLIQHSKSVIDKLCENFNWILIDSPAGVDSGFDAAIQNCNEAIVVVTPHISSIRDSDKVISILKSRGINNIRLCANRLRGDLVASGLMISASEIEKQLKIPLIGSIPESDYLAIFSTLCPNNSEPAFSAFRVFANNLIFDKSAKFDYMEKYQGIFGSFRRMLKRKI